MTRAEMLSMYFVMMAAHAMETKHHAEDIFGSGWHHGRSGAASDLGYPGDALTFRATIHQHIVDADEPTTESLTLTQRDKEKVA